MITCNPEICGGSPCLAGTRIPVWTLVRMLQLDISEKEILENYPCITANQLSHAWLYAQNHPDEIQTSIEENEK